ncbi:MAG: hypothetical protein JXA06_10530 [Bacteroidetes bacterium]|nr:hypothetical protein [Bacteroidota bacterium]
MHGQNSERSITYLKNGSIIKGVILEIIPDSTIKIQTADESILIFKMSEVEKIEKYAPVDTIRTVSTYPVPVAAARYTAVPYDKKKSGKRGTFSIFGGVAFPTGDFDDETNGCANTGFCAGLQYVSGGQIGFLINLSLIANPTNMGISSVSTYDASGVSDSWITIPLMCGLKIGTTNSNGINLFFAPLIGFCISTSPEIRLEISQAGYNNSYAEAIMEPGVACAVAYGAELEINLDMVNIGACYIATKPKFESQVSISSYSSNYDTEFQQSIWILQLYLGIPF